MKYRWDGVGTMTIRFHRKAGADEAVVRFDSALCDAASHKPLHKSIIEAIHLHIQRQKKAK